MNNAIDKTQFTHYGWFYGIVPVYVDMTNEECPGVTCRHWTIEPLMSVVDNIANLCCYVASLFSDDFEPMFSIKLTGRIK